MKSTHGSGASLAISVTILLLLISGTSLAASPVGFKARITASALNYASTQAVNALATELPKTKIPDQAGSSGHVSYSLENIAITSFNKPASNIHLNPGQSLTWSASNADIALHADWHAKYKQGWFKISDHGSLDVSLRRISFSISIAIRADGDGRPAVVAAGCSCSIGEVQIKFHGDIVSQILNVFRGQVEQKVRDIIPRKVCDALNSLINNNAEQQLKKIKVVTGLLDDRFLLDYRLVANPHFDTTYMETYHKGEITWKAKPESPPFSPTPIPSSAATQNMLYLWIGQYLPQSFIFAAQNNSFLQYNLTAHDALSFVRCSGTWIGGGEGEKSGSEGASDETSCSASSGGGDRGRSVDWSLSGCLGGALWSGDPLPSGNQSIFNTTCTGFLCVGKLIPAVGEKYPNCTVELHMNSTTLPLITMDTGVLASKMAGDIAFYARTPQGELPYLLTLNVSSTFNMSASVTNQILVGKIIGSSFNVGVLRSAVGDLNDKVINTMVGLAMKLFIIPKLNEKGAHGFPLPVTDKIKFVNSQLQIQQGALMIATDLLYTP